MATTSASLDLTSGRARTWHVSKGGDDGMAALQPVRLDPVLAWDGSVVGQTALGRPIAPPWVLWRDPHAVPPAELRDYIEALETACAANPQSADLRTCLGIAYAMNLEAYKSLDAFQLAVATDEKHFFAQLKYSELLYRLRALERAEEETGKALGLASNWWELSLARNQLELIRQKRRKGTQRPEWNKPLRVPAMVLGGLMVIASIVMVIWK